MTGTNPGAWPDQEPNEPQMSRYTAADLARAEEKGRREVWAYVQSISALLPAGEEFWSKKRDVYIIDAAKFHALLAEGKKEETE